VPPPGGSAWLGSQFIVSPLPPPSACDCPLPPVRPPPWNIHAEMMNSSSDACSDDELICSDDELV
jgi:hypothetical protein